MRDYEKKLELTKKANAEEDDTLVQLRKEGDALIEKVKLGELYIKQLALVENSLVLKADRYRS